jgi:UDP-3-O-[3-hydroxymyristoyl] N-acetylglucosamine deacetylase
MSGSWQETLKHSVVCAGVGVHSGQKARLIIRPAAAGSGITFRRTDLTGIDNLIPANAFAVSDTAFGTTLANASGASIAVVEHLLAALFGLGVDNAEIDVNGPEIPIMDGSSSVFYALLMQAGLKKQPLPRRRIRVLQRVEVSDGPKYAALSPSNDDRLSLHARIEYDDPHIGVQQMGIRLMPGSFARDLAFARTFGFARDVEMLRGRGLALGGSLENAVVIGDDGIMNPEGLRVEDEFIRHKILDAIGDLALAGAPIAGTYEAIQPGHSINNQLVRALLSAPEAWTWEEAAEAGAALLTAAG